MKFNFFKKKYGTGAGEDYRSPEQRAKDYSIHEIVASSAYYKWEERPWRKFNVRNQSQSGSCVKQSLAKLSEVLYFAKTGEKVPFSAGFYKFRGNFPAEGMWGTDAFDLWINKGITLESILPSQNLSELQMNTMHIPHIAFDTAQTFRLSSNYVQFIAGQDFETIASTIGKTGKAVMVWFRFYYDEWTDVPQILRADPPLHHSVTAVDAVLYNGKKYLVIEDSWGKFGKFEGQRLVSEEFFKARNTFAAYPITFKFQEQVTDRPKYDGSIISVQKCLRFEGLFPLNVDYVESFGPVTKKAVGKFQVKHGLHPIGTGTLGPLTVAKLKELYI